MIQSRCFVPADACGSWGQVRGVRKVGQACQGAERVFRRRSRGVGHKVPIRVLGPDGKADEAGQEEDGKSARDEGPFHSLLLLA